jgi:hypothetical protein
MHSNLIMPWSTKQEDEHSIALAELVHTLTREIARASTEIQRSQPSQITLRASAPAKPSSIPA